MDRDTKADVNNVSHAQTLDTVVNNRAAVYGDQQTTVHVSDNLCLVGLLLIDLAAAACLLQPVLKDALKHAVTAAAIVCSISGFGTHGDIRAFLYMEVASAVTTKMSLPTASLLFAKLAMCFQKCLVVSQHGATHVRASMVVYQCMTRLQSYARLTCTTYMVWHMLYMCLSVMYGEHWPTISEAMCKVSEGPFERHG